MVSLTTESDELLVSATLFRGGWILKSILMYRSFWLFIKQELKTYILLRTFSEVTSLSEVTISCVLLGTSLEVMSLPRMIVLMVLVTCFIGNTYIKGADIESTYIPGTYAERAYI